MATEMKADMTESELLYYYLGLRLQKGDRRVPLDELLTEFPRYRRQLEAVRNKILEAEESSAAGKSGPIDWTAFSERIHRRLSDAGISE